MGAVPTSPVELLAEKRGGMKTSHKVKIGRKRFPQGGTDGYPGNRGLVATVVFELLLFHHPPCWLKRVCSLSGPIEDNLDDWGLSGREEPIEPVTSNSRWQFFALVCGWCWVKTILCVGPGPRRRERRTRSLRVTSSSRFWIPRFCFKDWPVGMISPDFYCCWIKFFFTFLNQQKKRIFKSGPSAKL